MNSNVKLATSSPPVNLFPSRTPLNFLPQIIINSVKDCLAARPSLPATLKKGARDSETIKQISLFLLALCTTNPKT